jgi:hypothetical protein
MSSARRNYSGGIEGGAVTEYMIAEIANISLQDSALSKGSKQAIHRPLTNIRREEGSRNVMPTFHSDLLTIYGAYA